MLEPEDPIIYQINLNKQEDSTLSSIGVLVFSILIIIFIYSDYVRYSTSLNFIMVPLLKLIVFAVSIIVYTYLKVSKENKSSGIRVNEGNRSLSLLAYFILKLF